MESNRNSRLVIKIISSIFGTIENIFEKGRKMPNFRPVLKSIDFPMFMIIRILACFGSINRPAKVDHQQEAKYVKISLKIGTYFLTIT